MELLFEINHFFLKVCQLLLILLRLCTPAAAAAAGEGGGGAAAAAAAAAAPMPSPPLPCKSPMSLTARLPAIARRLLPAHAPFPLRPAPQALLWVPPTNPLNTYRLTTTFLIALPGFKARCLAVQPGVRGAALCAAFAGAGVAPCGLPCGMPPHGCVLALKG